MRPDILQQVRESFRLYYSIADVDDAAWFDALAMAWSGLTQGMSIPRAMVPMECRLDLERSCDAAERQFMFVRDMVQRSPSFQRLPPGEQEVIKAVFFDPCPLPVD